MPVTQDTHLSTEEQRSWIDNIILPALRASCPDDVLQHHPRSFNEVLRKAGIQGENTLHGQHQDLDLRYCVPERCLNEFSNQVLHRCNNQAGYQNAFYVISAHDLKLTTKRPSLLQCRTDFINILTQCFEYSSVTFPTVDCWLDLGHEDTPSATTGHAVTLLRKRACLSAWSKLFSCPKSSAHHLACDTYPWAGTWMAGTATITLKEQNSLHTVMSYNKSYNLHKNIFTTPLKNYLPFDNPQFEAERIVLALCRTKQRLAESLAASTDTNFGIRQEYRIRMDVLEKLNEQTGESFTNGQIYPPLTTSSPCRSPGSSTIARTDVNDNMAVSLPMSPTGNMAHTSEPQSPAGNIRQQSDPYNIAGTSIPNQLSEDDESSRSSHMPYWIIPTRVANNFCKAQRSRWLFYLEVVASRVIRGRADKPPSNRARQLLEGRMVVVVLRMLQLSFGKIMPEQDRAYWKPTCTENPRDPQRKLKLAQKPYQLPFTKTKSLHKDLSYKDKRLELFRNLLQQARRNVPPEYPSGRQRRFLRLVPELRHHVPSISFESQINKAYVSADENDIDLDLASTPYEVLRTGAELVIQNYIQYVWLTVGQRLDRFTRNGNYN
ncbi:hypothetical protein MMC32_008424 [Xylographa parallela]|nr:hypothetical protein [Xylographa parallela]